LSGIRAEALSGIFLRFLFRRFKISLRGCCMSKKSGGKPVDLPIYGDAAHNMAVYHAIGVLVINWAIDESVFRAMLQALMRGEMETAAVAWFSHHNTAARLELVSRLCRQHIDDAALVADTEAAIKDFSGCTAVRNFFCHATYHMNAEAELQSAESINLMQVGKPLRRDARLLDKQSLNHIIDAASKLADMNEALWSLVEKIETALGVPHVKPRPSRP
jgi:hypothetical protein